MQGGRTIRILLSIVRYNEYHKDENDDMYMQNVDEDIDLEYPSSKELLSGRKSTPDRESVGQPTQLD
ncbi:Hypothetical predicted protein [Olea europaea subsp. europaea]|uniref:Uncharacterized protein n=1 Tax=Olea europaea subsp. europaea TaxID=158383 RepID=A0A8S0RP18_OLEEU|nr:Hypothetical predicted protein [Olea europaea subsp. europaea]